MNNPIPLSLYIHIPWCVAKCPYCDFNSHALNGAVPEQDYNQQLLRDLESQLPSVWGRRVDTIFIGGGTPSLYSAQGIDALLSAIRARLPLRAQAEITLESNPGTADASNYAGYLEAGVNRLSLGIQSLNDVHLQKLGRIHNADQAIAAVKTAQAVGFERINCDLMFGLGGQTLDQAMTDLEAIIALQPEHISWYQLTIEPNTAYYSEPPQHIPDPDLIAEIQDRGEALLNSAGYYQYEVSAWARNGAVCQHNINYWQFGDYLGIGAGAHGKITDPASQQIFRTRNRKQPRDWLDTHSVLQAERKAIAKDELPFEFFMNALRLKHGVERKLFYERTGLNPETISRMVNQGIRKGWLVNDNQIYATTETGYNFLNNVLELFLEQGELIIKQVLEH